MKGFAQMSESGLYRYRLTRIWDHQKPLCGYMMLNPSTADHSQDDPTIRRCIGFAKREGFGGFHVVNLMAWRATKPTDLPADDAFACGPENADTVYRTVAALGKNGTMIVAWGAGGDKRPDLVSGFLHGFSMRGVQTYCLGLTSTGQPRHPLMVPNKQELLIYK
tara:strand:- start:6497 stop:6988 length:492 start_codon:yes stop_codon:yes gene_type:complete